MAEYIEREAAIKEIYRFDGYLDDDMIWRLHYALRKFPAADVVARDCYDRLLAENDELRKERPVVRGKWVLDGVQMIINLENAREQYKELGYPHRNELRMRCSNCKKITMVDASIRYEYCPHCGADMREVEHD